MFHLTEICASFLPSQAITIIDHHCVSLASVVELDDKEGRERRVLLLCYYSSFFRVEEICIWLINRNDTLTAIFVSQLLIYQMG